MNKAMKKFITPEEFDELHADTPEILEIVHMACKIHEDVNQHYGDDDALPYSYHIVNVVEALLEVSRVDGEVVLWEVFGAAFHDTIEDARLTYNDVMKMAKNVFKNSDISSYLATEVVYALTNEKGRTRAERANDKYYEGIVSTLGASLIKLCDRYANMLYSMTISKKSSMGKKYKEELPHFIECLKLDKKNKRVQGILQLIYGLIGGGNICTHNFQVDDWAIFNGYLRKIKSINNHMVTFYGCEIVADISTLEPIKLEVDDLLSNGFKSQDCDGHIAMRMHDGEHSSVVIVYENGDKESPVWSYSGEKKEVKYVHQLQHILTSFGYAEGSKFRIL